jgi:hypothetical protein
MSPFIPGKTYKRSSIHDQYGGNRQGGISPCLKYPFIFIFSGAGGEKHGYYDRWDNKNIYTYTGEGQVGDMKFTKGNLALKDHISNNKRIFLFQYSSSGYVQFISELEFYDVDYFETPDRLGNTRIGIKFFFKRKGIALPDTAKYFQGNQILNEPTDIGVLDLPNITERLGLVTSRVGQGAYRKRIVHRWEYECAVTGFQKPEILIASHIVPWRNSTDQERVDVDNGILLSPVYDALFDRHLISFENSGRIILSDQIESQEFLKIGVTGKEKIKRMSQLNFPYLERHRNALI